MHFSGDLRLLWVGGRVQARATPETDGIRAAVRAQLAGDRFDDAWATVRPLLLADGDGVAWNLARTVVHKGVAGGWHFCPHALR